MLTIPPVGLSVAVLGSSLAFCFMLAVVVTCVGGESCCRRGLSRRLVLAALVFLVLFGIGVQRKFQRRQPASWVVNVTSIESTPQQTASDASDAPASDAERELEELFNELNAPRIQLDNQEAASPGGGDSAKESSAPADATPTAESDRSQVALEDTEPARVTMERSVSSPPWLGKPRHNLGNLVRVVVKSDPLESLELCEQQLDGEIALAVGELVDEMMHTDDVSGMNTRTARKRAAQHLLERLEIDVNYLRGEVCPPDGLYVESKSTSVGDMKVAHRLLEFGPGIQQELGDRARAARVHDRVAAVIVISFLLLALLAGFYALMYFDTITKGYYTRRLIVGVPVAIMVLVVLVLALSQE